VIDSIFSTGQHYNAVRNVVGNYSAAVSRDQEHKFEPGSISELLYTFEAAGSSGEWAINVAKNKKPAHTRPGAVLKAEVVWQAAQLLVTAAVNTVEDLRASDPEHLEKLQAGWKNLHSQRSGVTFNYFLILAGMQGIKLDRMVERFVAEIPGTKLAGACSRVVLECLHEAASELEVQPRDLDHVMWRFASKRQFLLADPERPEEA